MLLYIAILLQIIAVLITLTTLVFLMACGANSTDRQLLILKRLIWATFLIGVAGLIGLIFMLIDGRYAGACLFGILPSAWCVALFLWMFLTGAPKKPSSPPGDAW